MIPFARPFASELNRFGRRRGANSVSVSLTDLVAYWKLVEVGGTRADSVGANTLTDNNSVLSAAGIQSNAAAFVSASSQRLSVASNAAVVMDTVSFTISCWCYFQAVNVTQGIVTKKGASNEYNLYLFSSGKFTFELYGQTSGSTTLFSTPSAVINAWHFVVAWWDRDARTLNIQINDGAIASAAATFVGETRKNTNDLNIGSYGTTLYNNGRIDEVGLWKRILTTAEKTSLYAGGAGISYPFSSGVTLNSSVTLQPSDLAENGYSTNNTTYYSSSPFAVAKFTTTATVIGVDVVSTSQSAYPQFSQVNVRVDGADYTALNPKNNGALERLYTSLPAGSKTIEIVSGLQTKPSSTPLGTFLVGVAANAALTLVAPSSSNRLLVYGDSISVGANSLVPSRDGWVMLLRNLRSNVMSEGYGFRSLYDDANTGGLRAAFVARLASYAPAIIWLAIGTNDYGLNKWSAANFGTAYAALLDDLHTALPSATIYAQTPLTRTVETANTFSDTLGNYRTQITTAQSTRSSYCNLVDGTAISATLDTDGLHPTTAGHSAYYLSAKATLGL